MTAARTQAALAAALADPLLIEAWRRGRSPRPVGLSDTDLDTLRRFGGLSYKVRHNGLRSFMPVTFQLLRTFEIELDLFAAYFAARTRDRTTLAASDQDRMRALMTFVRDWRRPGAPGHDLLWDIARHESALATLGMADSTDAGPAAPLGGDMLEPGSRLTVAGHLIRHDLLHDPAPIALAARSIEELDQISVMPVSMGYWRRPENTRIEQIRLDAFAAAILDAIDGAVSLDTISRRLLGIPASATFVAMAGELVALGIVALVEP